jgi:hypothetical protein
MQTWSVVRRTRGRTRIQNEQGQTLYITVKVNNHVITWAPWRDSKIVLQSHNTTYIFHPRSIFIEMDWYFN